MRRLQSAAGRTVGALVVVAVIGALVGCAGNDESAVTTVEISPSTVETTPATSEPSAVSTPAETTPPETTASSTAPPETNPPPPAVPAESACLVGAWIVTEDQMDRFYSGLMSTVEAPLTIDATGSAPLTFRADGTYSWAPGFELAVEVGGASGTGIVRGSVEGNWSVVDGLVRTVDDLNALDVSIEVNGVTFSGNDLANGLLNRSPVDGVTYSCDGPVLDFQTADPSVTVPVTLASA